MLYAKKELITLRKLYFCKYNDEKLFKGGGTINQILEDLTSNGLKVSEPYLRQFLRWVTEKGIIECTKGLGNNALFTVNREKLLEFLQSEDEIFAIDMEIMEDQKIF